MAKYGRKGPLPSTLALPLLLTKFEAQNMENEGSLDYKLYKTISLLPSTSFLIQPESLDFLTTICGTKSNHRMKAKEEGMRKELSIGYEDTSITLSLNPFHLCHELSFKELKLLLKLNTSYSLDILEFFPGFEKDKSFLYHLPFEDVDINLFFGTISKKLFLSSFNRGLLKGMIGSIKWLSMEEKAPTTDCSPAPTIDGRLLSGKAWKSSYLSPMFPFFESIDFGSSSFVIWALRGSSIKGGHLGKDLDRIVQSKRIYINKLDPHKISIGSVETTKSSMEVRHQRRNPTRPTRRRGNRKGKRVSSLSEKAYMRVECQSLSDIHLGGGRILDVLKCIEEEDITVVMKDRKLVTIIVTPMGEMITCGSNYKGRRNLRPPSHKELKLTLLLGAFDLKDYIE
ncbi:hypothetical protein M9H77_02451 [Catharanthus roseus]|uniref:Uncharacterized protein n=1 Tax=Catharanthus roseus TaxID=4058 RepID=A0ACC0C8V4_CATRO|nr:hypothetical protein M9H77_02451 [Catharanthus roseus]